MQRGEFNDDAVKDARGALEHFVIDNDELRALEELIGRFNIFDALGISASEIRHSNFLAWLLDPAESHGLGSLFLTPVLMDILRQIPSSKRAFSAVELDAVQVQGVEVRREWHHIDLLILAKQPQFAIAIENKIWSTEHSDQLRRYKETVERECGHIPAARRFFVFLSPESSEPSDNSWISYNYSLLYDVLYRTRASQSGVIGHDVGNFLDHYLRLLRSRVMQTDDVRNLCQMIYKKHRQALDLIFQYKPSPDGGLLDRVERELRSDPRWYVWKRDSYYVYFAPKRWLEELPKIGDRLNVEPNQWIYFFFEVLNNKLRRSMQVAPCADVDRRQKAIEGIRDRFGVQMRGKAKTQWTRLHSDVLAEWSDDELPDEEKLIPLIKAELDSTYAKFADLASFVTSDIC